MKNIIVKGKVKLNIPETMKKIQGWFNDNNYWRVYFEMQYKNIKLYVIIEEYLEDKNSAGVGVEIFQKITSSIV